MSRLLYYRFFFIALLTGGSPVSSNRARFNTELTQAFKILTDASWNSANALISPLSIEMNGALAYLISRGTTRYVITNFLYPDYDALEAQGYIEGLLSRLARALPSNPDDGPTLHLANHVIVDNRTKTYKITQQRLKRRFGDKSVVKVDFSRRNLVGYVNSLVARETNKKIKNILPQNSVNENTGLLLVNALYFSGQWKQPFLKNNTQKNVFVSNSGKEVQVNMMRMKNVLLFFENDYMQVVRLDFARVNGIEAHAYFMLPKDRQLSKMFRDIKADWRKANNLLSSPLNLFEYYDVTVSLPKFKTDFSVDLADTFIRMGITQAFDIKRASFGAFVDKHKKIRIANVFHKTSARFDENGVEATAATVDLSDSNRQSPKSKGSKIFNANRPFAYVLAMKHENRDLVILAGQYRGVA